MAKESGCVLLADQHHGLIEGVRGLLAAMFEAVVMVADESSLMESTERLAPKVAVVALGLAGGNGENGFGLMRRMRQRFPKLKVILLSVHDEPTVARAAIEAGADGFVVKRSIASELLPAVEAVLAGRRYVPAKKTALGGEF
jgi:DNA-binding NarL/FixJ family response regulator